MSTHFTHYCDGKVCALRTTCRRYTEGQRIKSSRSEGQYYWMDCCDPETRNMYINTADPQ